MATLTFTALNGDTFTKYINDTGNTRLTDVPPGVYDVTCDETFKLVLQEVPPENFQSRPLS